MNIWIVYIYLISFSFVFGYYNGWQWTDEQDGVYDPKKAKKHWKAASVVLRTMVVFSPLLFTYFPVDWKYVANAGAISLPIFDITINLTRGVKFFYLGTTSKTDRVGKKKWIFLLIMIIITSAIVAIK